MGNFASNEVLLEYNPIFQFTISKLKLLFDLNENLKFKNCHFVGTDVFDEMLKQVGIKNHSTVAYSFAANKEYVNMLYFMSGVVVYTRTHWYNKLKCNG